MFLGSDFMFNTNDSVSLEWTAYNGIPIFDRTETFSGPMANVLRPNFSLSRQLSGPTAKLLVRELYFGKDAYSNNIVLTAYVGREATTDKLQSQGYKIDNQNGRFDFSKPRRVVVDLNEEEKIATILASLGENDLCFETIPELDTYLKDLAEQYLGFKDSVDRVKTLLMTKKNK